MGKKKIFKNDGTEDFDAEALEPEMPEEAGNVSDMAGAASNDASKDEGKDSPAPDAISAVALSQDKPSASEVPAISASDSSGSDAGKPESESDGSGEGTSTSTDTDKAQDAPEQAALSEPVPEAQSAVDAAPDVLNALKDAGNSVTPALKQLGNLEGEIGKLEDEAKARFTFARQKATEFVAALEAIFKRG